MFTGLIKELGKVRRLDKRADLYRLVIESKEIFKGVKIGDSVSIDGVCLTLVEKDKNILSFDCVDQTARTTNLKRLKKNDLVNLEDSLKAGDPLGGHFVLGHIDCVGKIRGLEKRGEEASMEIEVPKEFSHLVVEKGPIAIDGISLTVAEVMNARFIVYLVPHTLKATTLGSKKVGDELNVEFDVLGKYIVRSKNLKEESRITEEFLKEKGFYY